MSTETTTKSYIVRDSRTGDEIQITKDICFRCKLPVDSQNPHNACRREIASELSFEKERQRREQSKLIFGEVLDKNEYYIRLHPDDSYLEQETYNNRLKRLAEEAKQVHYKKLADREQRKHNLPFLENQLKSLRAQIEHDEREAEEEKAQEQQSTK